MIPLINGGQTPVFNVEINVTIPDKSLELVLGKDTYTNSSFIQFKSENKTIFINRIINTLYIPIIMPSEKKNLLLSNYLNPILAKLFEKNNPETIKDFNLKLLIKYQNYKSENKKNEYIVNIEFEYLEKDKNGIVKIIGLRATALKKLSNEN